MTQHLIAIDPNALQSLRDDIAKLQATIAKMQFAPTPEWLTLADYAKHVGRTERTVRNWKDAGQIETKREGNATLVRVSPTA